MSKLSTFNNMAEEFLNQMSKTFPDEPKLRGYYQLFKATRKMSVRQPVKMFMESLEPYGIEIMTRNEDFFKLPDHVEYVERLSGKMGLIDYWSTMKPEVKNAIWEFFQGLYVLGMSVTGRDAQLHAVLAEVQKITSVKN